jgi:hypothetical protein
MLDEILELFERDKKKRYGRPTGKRSLMDRVSGMLGDNDRRYDGEYRRHEDNRRYADEHRHDDDRARYGDERYRDDRYPSSRYDDDRPRYADDRYERRDDDADDRRRYDDDRYRDSQYRKPSKKRRLMDLLDVD